MPRKKTSKGKNTLKSITKQISAIRNTQTDIKDTSQASSELLQKTNETVETISLKVSKIVGVLARNAASVKNIQQQSIITNERLDKVEQDVYDIFNYVTEPEKEQVEKTGVVAESISSIAQSITSINNSFGLIQDMLTKSIEAKKGEEYKQEEAALEKKLEKQAAPVRVKSEEGDSFFSSLKSFFTNPAVIAAFSGLVYLFLPKDIKEKINAFFRGFASGGDKTSEELSTFEKAVIAAGAGIGLYFGAKLLTSAGEAAITLLKLIGAAKRGLKKLGPVGAAAAVTAVATAGFVVAKRGDKAGTDEDTIEDDDEEEPAKPTTAPTLPSVSATQQAPAQAPQAAAVQKPTTATQQAPTQAPQAAIKQAPQPAAVQKPAISSQTTAQNQKQDVTKNIELIKAALKEQGITDEKYTAGTIGNIIKESGGKPVGENLNYGNTSNERIRSIFGDRAAKYSDDQLNEIKKDPVKMAELMYGKDTVEGKKMGNTEVGDGWKFRGRGFIQLTGKKNYAAASKSLFNDDRLVNNPDLVNDPVIAAKTAAWYMKEGQSRMAKRMGFDVNNLTQEQANMLTTSQIAGKDVRTGSNFLKGEILSKVTTYAEQYGATARAPVSSEAAALVAGASRNTGMVLASASETTASPTINRTSTNVIGGTSVVAGGKGQNPPPAIPTTVANRGTLDVGTRHSTAYS